ncbi:hypothetical protein [Pontibacter rugosus]|uniref:DUF4136 domain-containing protein n=1 Tax=Pontibacter rugosus TaxID=1745966 RepID=A0ABW3SM00_9BACT
MKTSIRRSSQKLLYVLACVVMAAGMYSCAPSTQITGTWKSPQATSRTFNNVVVAAMTDNVQARQTIEDQLQQQLQARGIKATKSIDLFPPSMMSGSESPADMMLDRITSDGFDGILTVAVVDQETDTRYVPGNTAYAPVSRFGYYNTFRGYYGYMSPTLYQPGYYTKEKIYFLETNLYETSNENLVWSAQSKSYDPASLSSFADTFSEITVKKMAQENIIN